MLLEELSRRGVRKLLVEGGETVIWSFLKAGVVDRFHIYVGSLVLGGHGPTPCGGDGVKRVEEAMRMKLKGARKLGDGVLLSYEPLG
jgi:2,5-diamino-6-(ribosylamino)-4(3H)-pyrimidinone 5'-phosphate reductase